VVNVCARCRGANRRRTVLDINRARSDFPHADLALFSTSHDELHSNKRHTIVSGQSVGLSNYSVCVCLKGRAEKEKIYINRSRSDLPRADLALFSTSHGELRNKNKTYLLVNVCVSFSDGNTRTNELDVNRSGSNLSHVNLAFFPTVVGCKIPRKENSPMSRFFSRPPFLFPRVHPRLTRRLIKTGAPHKNNRVD